MLRARVSSIRWATRSATSRNQKFAPANPSQSQLQLQLQLHPNPSHSPSSNPGPSPSPSRGPGPSPSPSPSLAKLAQPACKPARHAASVCTSLSCMENYFFHLSRTKRCKILLRTLELFFSSASRINTPDSPDPPRGGAAMAGWLSESMQFFEFPSNSIGNQTRSPSMDTHVMRFK